MNEYLHDPLKPLDKICDPDERQASFVGTLADRHSELQSITLNDAVPIDVKQLFETSKNLSLYSWFVYRFHQVAELMSFCALEMALRKRYLAEISGSEKSKKRLSFYDLMQHAKKEKWITNEGFSNLHAIARHNAEFKKMLKNINTHDFKKYPEMLIDEPTEEEIQEELANLDRVTVIAENASKIRNDLAHGSNTLTPNSIATLRLNAEIINQLYP